MSKIIQYKDLINIPVFENNEPFVVVQDFVPMVHCVYEKIDMKKYLGEKIILRKKVAEKLAMAALNLKKKVPTAQFKLVYGYRHPEIQKKYFDIQFNKQQQEYKNLSDSKLTSKTHLLVASPDVAGHPTGGAIDITIITKDGPLDMGTAIGDFSDIKKIETFNDFINKDQKKNRLMLRNLLIEQGFAPFDGEWWHFSYGDREWAAYYKKPRAIYNITIIDKKKLTV